MPYFGYMHTYLGVALDRWDMGYLAAIETYKCSFSLPGRRCCISCCRGNSKCC